MKKIITIIYKLLLSIVGWFLVWGIFAFIISLLDRRLPILEHVLRGGYSLLQLPFQELWLDTVTLFVFIFMMPSQIRTQLIATGNNPDPVIAKYGIALLENILPFICILITIILFERRKNKDQSSTIIFYLLVPGIILLVFLRLVTLWSIQMQN